MISVEFEDLKVPANATRYLLFYTEMHVNPTRAKKSIRKYDPKGLSSALLQGIPKHIRSKVLNWRP